MAKPKTQTILAASRKSKKHKKYWLFLLIPLFFIGYLTLNAVSSVFRPVLNTVGKVSFERQLPVPALAVSTVGPDGTRVFDLTLQSGTTNIFDDTPTTTWGINGPFLGQTLRAKRGEKVQINTKNALPETSSIHWHGMHLPAAMDGGPHQPIKSGATWSPYWTINQPAATLWYHPHPHGETEKHVYQGLAGMFIIDDDSSTAANLPHEYGRDDFPVIVQDKHFDKKRQLALNRDGGGPTGMLGDEILVNGARTPHLNVSKQLVRLRLLNGSTARVYNFGLSNNQPMQLIATDGGLLERPITLNRIALSPGERAEVVVAVRANEKVTLRSYPYDLGGIFIVDRLDGSKDTFDVLQLRPASTLAVSPEIPKQLVSIDRLAEANAKASRQFNLTSDTSINLKSMDLNRIDFTVRKGDTEIWEVTNQDVSHVFHIHDVQFQVLSLDGAPPPPELDGWKDSILLKSGQQARLIMQFKDYSDPDHPYMFHCHLLRHEDQGMMGQFLVIEPGQTPKSHLDTSGHGH